MGRFRENYKVQLMLFVCVKFSKDKLPENATTVYILATMFLLYKRIYLMLVDKLL